MCDRTALVETLARTDGLCMLCYGRWHLEIKKQQAEATRVERLELERNAIVLPETAEEDRFLFSCAVYCEIDCCGFNAIDISEDQFHRSVVEVGLDAAKAALLAMRAQIDRIGEHDGYVRFRHYYEPASAIKTGYQQVCVTLERVLDSGQVPASPSQ